MKKRAFFFTIICLILLTISSLISVGTGRYPIDPSLTLNIIFDKIMKNDMSQYDPTLLTVLFTIRIPRICADILVGAGLAVAGASYQAIFQNPLVSSDILGVSNGASVGAALAMIIGLNHLGIQGLAFIFGIFTVCFSLLLSSAFKEKNNLTLVLSGMIVSGLMSSALSFIKFTADVNNSLPEIVYWLMGSMSSVTASDVKSIILPVLFCLIILFLLSWKINIVSIGENEAKLLGINVFMIKIACIVCSSVLTVCAVCISGVIGWFGLMTPHISRLIVGNDNRFLLPFTAVFGSLLMVLLDTVARTALVSEIPIGILTGFVGTIVFSILIIFRRTKNET